MERRHDGWFPQVVIQTSGGRIYSRTRQDTAMRGFQFPRALRRRPTRNCGCVLGKRGKLIKASYGPTTVPTPFCDVKCPAHTCRRCLRQKLPYGRRVRPLQEFRVLGTSMVLHRLNTKIGDRETLPPESNTLESVQCLRPSCAWRHHPRRSTNAARKEKTALHKTPSAQTRE